jgi:hypothetical protein
LYVLLCFSFLVCPPQSTLITFDDITNSTETEGILVPNNYHGLTWNNALVMDGLNMTSIGYITGVVSPPYIVFDGYGRPMSFRSTTASTFTINSFYSCAAWFDDVKLTINGTRSGNVLYTKTIPLLMENRTFIELNWSGIDNIYLEPNCFTCCDAKQFTMDNLCVTF